MPDSKNFYWSKSQLVLLRNIQVVDNLDVIFPVFTINPGNLNILLAKSGDVESNKGVDYNASKPQFTKIF